MLFKKAHCISTNCHGAKTIDALPLTTDITESFCMALLLSSLLLASAVPLKIKHIVCIQFVYAQVHTHKLYPVNQCN